MNSLLQQPLGRLLTFPPELEREFEDEKREQRVSHFMRCGCLGLFLYDFFLLYQWQLMPDAVGLAAILSFGVFTPLMIVAICGPTRSSSVRVRETTWTVLPIIAGGFFVWVSTASSSPYKLLSYADVVLVMVFTTAVQRLRLRYTLVANFGMLLAVGAGVATSSAFDVHSGSATMIFFVVAFVLMVMAAYALEREGRLAYLAERQTRLLNAELARVAQVDPLTDLWNRRFLDDLMAKAWSAAETDTSMSVILIDVDHFKRFNDTFGHAAGDICLVTVAQCLTSCVGTAATAVRYGGEEFLLFLPGTGLSQAAVFAEAICAEMRERVIPLGTAESVSVSVSIGVACARASAATPSAVIRQADAALYCAKAGGRDRVCIAPAGREASSFSAAA